jgi:ABC-type multidrug transport system ATPase subunit
MITFANVTKKFGRHVAIHNLSFDVPAHRAVAMWGENGAGKTTVIKCLLGLLRYDGRILVHGLMRRATVVRRGGLWAMCHRSSPFTTI